MHDEPLAESEFFRPLLDGDSVFLNEKWNEYSNLRQKCWGEDFFHLATFFNGHAFRDYSVFEHLSMLLGGSDRLARSEILRYSIDGEPADRGSVSTIQHAHQQISEGGTLLSKNVESCLPLAKIISEFACRDVRHPYSVASFTSFQFGPSLHPHSDAVDLLVVQVLGSKKWEIWDKGAKANDTDKKNEVILKPGSLLYLPSGRLHYVEDLTGGSISINVYIQPTFLSEFLGDGFKELGLEDRLLSPDFGELGTLFSDHDCDGEGSYAAVVTSLARLLIKNL